MSAGIASPAPARKPVQPAQGLTCFCSHPQHDGRCQLNGCRCKRFQARPCACRHPMHNGSCIDPNCGCKSPHQDRSPEFLLRRGIGEKQWQFITVPQLHWLRRPCQEVKIQVWSLGMEAATGQRSRLAVKMDANRKLVPLTIKDIADQLGLLVRNVSRAIRELEQEGAARRGKGPYDRLLFFYLRPLKSRKLPTETDDGQVLRSEYLTPATDSNSSHLRIQSLRGQIVKTFHHAIGEECAQVLGSENLRLTPECLKKVDELLKPALEVLEYAYLKAVEVVRSAHAYKEGSIPESIKEKREPSSSSSSVVEAVPPEETTTTISSPSSQPPQTETPPPVSPSEYAGVRQIHQDMEVWARRPIAPESARWLLRLCRKTDPECTPAEIARAVGLIPFPSGGVDHPDRYLAKSIPPLFEGGKFAERHAAAASVGAANQPTGPPRRTGLEETLDRVKEEWIRERQRERKKS